MNNPSDDSTPAEPHRTNSNRDPLSAPDFKGQFSGHETFPLRQLWLGKAYQATAGQDPVAPKSVFTNADAVVRFGVGKNMVSAIRYWAFACGIIAEEANGYRPTTLGDFLFHPETGHDPFLEAPATAWLLHWMMAATPERTTTWYYAFNVFPAQEFEREALSAPLFSLCKERKWGRASQATIKRDVECFVRSYVSSEGAKSIDDSVDSVFADLGILRRANGRALVFQRGEKSGLEDGVFLFALNEFWQRHAPTAKTLSVEQICYAPGSPGRVFKLDEAAVVDRLARIESSSDGTFIWSDSAGIRTIAKRKELDDPLATLRTAYPTSSEKDAA